MNILTKFLIFLVTSIAIVAVAAGAYGKRVVLDTPYLIGEEIEISATVYYVTINQIVTIRAIMVDKDTMYYVIETKKDHLVRVFTLEQMKKMEVLETRL